MNSREIINIGERITMLIFAYSRTMVLGKISPKSRMMIVIGITIVSGGITSSRRK